MDKDKRKLIEEYNEDSFYVYDGLEAIRKDTSMYMNSRGVKGIMQMLIEPIDNAVDEAKALFDIHAVDIKIRLNKDGSASVEDNGRGIPFGIHSKYKIPACYITFERIHGGGKLKGTSANGYRGSIGVHGVGMACVTAHLSG